MSSLTDWGEVLTASFVEIWFKFVNLIPSIIGAAIVFIVILFAASSLGKLVATGLKKIYVDRAMETTGLKKILEKIGFKLAVSEALGLLVTWFLYAIALVAAADILGLNQISQFLQSVVLYIPHVIISIVILIVGIIVGNFVHTLVRETATAAKIEEAQVLANIAQWAILVFTSMAALIQLRVATELIQILFTGLVFMIALAGGIAFGLGGKDRAKEIVDSFFRR
ncbi:MAG: hypothetical protein HUU49_04765 [Candidatus Buchananbacteria bacterium]|nr:hypothetical protein [Candidatus Buchananbacteria bacterium]